MKKLRKREITVEFHMPSLDARTVGEVFMKHGDEIKRLIKRRRTKARAYLYRSHGQWRWRIVAANGRKLANGGESYKRRIDCLRMLERAMDGFGCDHYEVGKP